MNALARLSLLCVSALVLAGCWRIGPPDIPDIPDTGATGSVAFWGSTVSGLCILAGIIVLVVLRNSRLGVGLIASGFAGIIAFQVVAWLADHPWVALVLAGLGLLIGLGLYLWGQPKARAYIEKKLNRDLDQSGQVGDIPHQQQGGQTDAD